jgi:transcriptional regulator with XRE-family HTH domain
LCQAKGIAITALEKELGFGRGSIGKMKNSKKGGTSSDRLQRIANRLNVPIAQLTGEDEEWQPNISEKDEKDIKIKLDELINQLSTEAGLMYDGEPMDEESLTAVRAALEVAERTAMLEAKRKFTPDKYKK